ncbi:FadR/GntR family transcriptional regulator [Rhodococcus opacus]|uniref:FadR/GntR family transcriptional regulator n=1 Tax=Rhodococcus opacus TaxID=37919 RepID=UPI001C486C4C|nr:FCD domain-containing protein [Rhodococcus opacus]MBV6759292.1 FCD domain-containing protein [Rhodococcus opacus]
MTSSIRRHLLTDQAADLLRSRIDSGEWEIGTKLPGETTLAAELGVGRSTVREAVRMLAGLGMLESRQGAGVFLRRSSPRQDWDRVLRTEGILHVVEVRNTVEIEAARLAATRRDEADLQALRRALDARSAASGAGAAAFVDADIALHRAVVVAAHNPVLTELFETFVPRLRGAMLDLMDVREMTASSQPNADAHRLLVEAIADGDAAEAARVSAAHLERLRHL